MPVFVNGVPRYEIKPPGTSGDMGEATKSISADAARVFCFIEDERHLTAHALLTDVRTRLGVWQEAQHATESKSATRRRSKGIGFGLPHYKAGKKVDAAKKAAAEGEMKQVQELLQSKEKALDILEVCVHAIYRCGYLSQDDLLTHSFV